MRLRLVLSAFVLGTLLGLAGCLGSNDITGNVLLHSEATLPTPETASAQRVTSASRGDWLIENEVVVSFVFPDASATADAAVKPLGARRKSHRGPGQFAVYRFPGAAQAREARARLGLLPGIKSVEPNFRVTALAVSQPIPDALWNLRRIHLSESRTISAGSPEVVVAVLDTGFLTDHPDLAQAWTPPETWWDYVRNDSFPAIDNPAEKMAGHGTHVAGIIAAQWSAAMVGVAPSVRLLPIRVLDDDGTGDLATVAAAIDLAVSRGAGIISLSLGSEHTNSVLISAIQNAYANGVTVIAAAGNTGDTSLPAVLYPALIDTVIAVGAVDANNRRAAFSSYGPEVDLVAPGTEYYSALADHGIFSTVITADGQPGYGYFSGTSMACPHVSGVAALLASCGIGSPDAIRSWLEGTAIDLGPGGRDPEYGNGLVNAYAAMALPQMKISVRRIPGEPAAVPAVPQSTPSSSGRFVLRNVPEGDWILQGWLDANRNGSVDTSDSFGEYPAPLLIPGTDYRNLPLIVEVIK